VRSDLAKGSDVHEHAGLLELDFDLGLVVLLLGLRLGLFLLGLLGLRLGLGLGLRLRFRLRLGLGLRLRFRLRLGLGLGLRFRLGFVSVDLPELVV
jgi:hypothetical protein